MASFDMVDSEMVDSELVDSEMVDLERLIQSWLIQSWLIQSWLIQRGFHVLHGHILSSTLGSCIQSYSFFSSGFLIFGCLFQHMALSVAQQKFLLQLALLGISNVVLYFAFKWMVAQLDPNREKKITASVLVCILNSLAQFYQYTSIWNYTTLETIHD
jgi:hypothetical protein